MRTTYKAALTVALVTALGSLSGCGSDPVETKAAPVELSVPDAPSEVKVGVLWTRSSSSGQGADWRLNATGAKVAEYRLSKLGKTKVNVIAVNDGGKPESAAKAVNSLIDRGVAGIVVASSGSHLQDAIEVAARSGTPVLLPYARISGGHGVWHTGPTNAQVSRALRTALSSAGVDSPAAIVGRGQQGLGVEVPAGLTVKVDKIDAAEVRERLEKLATPAEGKDIPAVDGVVINAAPSSAAELVGIVQEVAPELPIVVPPDATSEGFAQALGNVGGAVTSNLITVGTDSGDTAALAGTPHGASAAAFLSAVRLAAGAKSARSLANTAIAGTAPFADSASHDAVVAIVAAAAGAKSTSPKEVRDALRKLELGAGDGVAGPPLNFISASAVGDASVVPLRASAQDPGLRPALPDSASDLQFQRIFWFDASD